MRQEIKPATGPRFNCLCLALAVVCSMTTARAGSASWTLTGSMSLPRRDHTATLLKNGKVLIVGCSSTRNAELFDPATGKFSMVTKTLFEHCGANAVRLLDGRVLLAGGGGPGFPQAEVYDPTSGRFSRTGDLNISRHYAAATLLPSGKVLIAGGTPGLAGGSAELYDPASGSFSLTGNLQVGRFGATASLLPDGRVIVVGGGNEDTHMSVDSAELYDEDSGSFVLTGTMLGSSYLWDSQAPVLANGRVLIIDGFTKSAELFDPVTGVFSATGAPPSIHSSGTVILLANGNVLVAGGYESVGPVTVATATLYDPANGTFMAAPSMNVARQQHTSTLLLDGRVLVTGGVNPLDGDLGSAEIFSLGDDSPIITRPPQTQTVEEGSTAVFSLRAVADPPPTYQWFFNGEHPIGNASTNSLLRLTNVQVSQSGTYSVLVSNRYIEVTSPPALLSVIAAVPRKLVPGITITTPSTNLMTIGCIDGLGGTADWTSFPTFYLTNSPQFFFDLSDPLPTQRFYHAWSPNPYAAPPSLDLHIVPAIILNGSVGDTLRLDFINQFGPTDAWVPLSTNTLTSKSQLYFDTSSIGQAPRFWRIVPVP